MTTYRVDPRRIAEGLCADLSHGALDPTDDGWGRCAECEVEFRLRGDTVYAHDPVIELAQGEMRMVLVGADFRARPDDADSVG